MRKLFLVACLSLLGLGLAGCHKKSGCHVSAAQTQPGPAQSAVDVSCFKDGSQDDVKRQIVCPPVGAALPMSCQCIENGIVGKKFDLTTKLGDANTAELARTQCGWAMESE
jgi:hypothetical protein